MPHQQVQDRLRRAFHHDPMRRGRVDRWRCLGQLGIWDDLWWDAVDPCEHKSGFDPLGVEVSYYYYGRNVEISFEVVWCG